MIRVSEPINIKLKKDPRNGINSFGEYHLNSRHIYHLSKISAENRDAIQINYLIEDLVF